MPNDNIQKRPAQTRAALAKRKPAGKKPRTKAEREARLREILDFLGTQYPDVECALTHRNAWELLVATILSAQCTDERVNMVTPGLFDKYPTPADLAAAPVEEIAEEVRSTGFFNNKAKSIKGAAGKVVSEFNGEVPKTMKELLSIPGVARKTANVVAGTAYGIPLGVVVDTHVQRIARRLGLTSEVDPKKIEQDLMKVLPEDHWIDFSHQLIWHGRTLCTARKPKCNECPIDSICFAADKYDPAVEAEKKAVKAARKKTSKKTGARKAKAKTAKKKTAG
jgi:endonuclease-3